MGQTLADLLSEIGITPQTPQQRFYQRPRLPADALMQPGDIQPASPSQVGGYLIDRNLARHADQEIQRRAQIMQRNGVDPTGNAPRSLPQIGGDLANMVFEGTGLPSAKRAIQHTYNSMQMGVGDQSMDEARAGTSDALMAGLNVALMAGPHVLPELPARRLPVAPVEEPATPLPLNPTRDLGYSNGSLLPVRPREPFRQSLQGGSADLAEAALPQRRSPQQQAPDARALDASNTPDGGGLGNSPEFPGSSASNAPARGGVDLAQLRARGFNTEQPLYRGMTRPLSGNDFSRDPALQGSERFRGVSFSRSRSEAGLYASGDTGTVYKAFMRGELADGPTYMREVQQRAKQQGLSNQEAALQIQQEYAQRGITGVEWEPNKYGQGGEVRIFDAANVTHAHPPNGGAAGAARPPDPDLPPRRRPRT